MNSKQIVMLLKIFDASTNKIKQEHELDPSIKPITSLIWGSSKHEFSSPEGDAVVNNNVHPLDQRSLSFGTGDDRLYSYDTSTAVSKKILPLVPDKTYREDTDTLPDPTKATEIRLTGLRREDRALLNMVLPYNDEEFIRKSVQRLPLDHLKFILLELHKRFSKPEERYNTPSLRKWLKEILSVHLQYINKREDLRQVLTMIQHTIVQLRINETKSTMSRLRGVLNILRIQNAFSDTSDSETEENMQT